MPGLDGARVHRADRNFVHAVACDLDEGIVIRALVENGRGLRIAPQRMRAALPSRVAQPGAAVFGRGIDADKVARGALHAVGGRKNLREIRVLARGQAGVQHEHALRPGEDEVQREALTAVALVRTPQRSEPATRVPHRPADVRQFLGRRRCLPCRHRAGQLDHIQREVPESQVFILYPISFAAWRYQSAR